jgi:hypothetical protein
MFFTFSLNCIYNLMECTIQNLIYPETTFYVGDGNIEQGRMQKLFWRYKEGNEGNPILAQLCYNLASLPILNMET